MYYIYVFQNLLNNKVYIGKTNNPEIRYKRHLNIVKNGKSIGKKKFNLIHAAILKYGIDNFSFQTIDEFEDEKECLESEKFWIEFFRSDVNRFGNECGYNLTAGGDGQSGNHKPKHTFLSKAKISEAQLGKKKGPQSKDHLLKRMVSIKKSYKKKYKIVWPEDNVLIEMVRKSSMRQVAKVLGISPQAVSHRFKVRNIIIQGMA